MHACKLCFYEQAMKQNDWHAKYTTRKMFGLQFSVALQLANSLLGVRQIIRLLCKDVLSICNFLIRSE